MIYVAGDIHGEYERFAYMRDSDGVGPEAGDTLVVAGDFGFLFEPRGTAQYEKKQRQLDMMAQLPYMILWVDGNHENLDLLESYPAELWHGGRVHRIRDNVLHLMRGQIFDIDGVKLFAMGGAYSIDSYMRREGVSVWSRELPCDDEYKEASRNPAAASFRVDIVVTHTAPREIICRMGSSCDVHDAQLTGFLEWVMYETDFDRWYFGHRHRDLQMPPKVRAVYYDTVRYIPGERV